MKVDLKLYKTFDADLVSLSSNGISISSLIKTALYHYVRGEVIRFYVPECKSFDLDGRRRYIHIMANIDDPVSINFLKNELKYRQRTAFLRTLIRECLVTQHLGAFFKNDEWINKETARMHKIDLTTMGNVVKLKFDERKHDYASEIIKPAKTASSKVKPKISEEKTEETKKDLALKEPSESKSRLLHNDEIDATHEEFKKPMIVPVETEENENNIPEDELPFENNGMGVSFFDDEDEDIEEDPTLDDDLLSQFKTFMD